MSVPYAIRLPLEVLDALRGIAKEERRSLTQQIGRALEEWVQTYRDREAA